MTWFSFFSRAPKLRIIDSSILDEPYSDEVRDTILSFSDWSRLPLLSFYSVWSKTLIPLASPEQLQSLPVDSTSFVLNNFYDELNKNNVPYSDIYTIASKLIESLPMDIVMKPYLPGHRRYSFGCFHPSLLLKILERAHSNDRERDILVRSERIIKQAFNHTHRFYVPRAYLEYPTCIQDIESISKRVHLDLDNTTWALALELCALESNSSYEILSREKIEVLINMDCTALLFTTFSPNYISLNDFRKFMNVYASYFSKDESYALHWICNYDMDRVECDHPALKLILDFSNENDSWESIKEMLGHEKIQASEITFDVEQS